MSRRARSRAELQAAAFDEGFEALCERLGVQAAAVRVQGDRMVVTGDSDVAGTVSGALRVLREVMAATAADDAPAVGVDLEEVTHDGR